MDSSDTLLALSHPLVVFLIGFAVLALWRGDAQRSRYLLCFGVSYLAYGLGVTAQIVMVPGNHALNVMFSGLMYMLAAMFFARGLIELSGSRYRYAAPIAIVVAALACRVYFLLVEEDGLMRSYCLHAAIFLLFIHSAYVARSLRKGVLAEKITFYAFILFTLSTPPRVLLMMFRPAGSYGVDHSAYWVATQVSIYAFAMVFGLALIIAIIQRYHRAQQASDENLSIISHDLRAPLATIAGSLHMLQKTATPEQLVHMEAIERNTRYQNSLINDILAGKQDIEPLEVNPEPMRLEPFLAELCLHGNTWCAQQNSGFSLAVLAPLPGQIVSDERRLKQALLNLLSNAALATRDGQVQLHVKCLPEEPGWARIHFEVHDTGPGIDPNHQPYLFDAYQRFDLQRPGTGLGLHIAQRIANNLGGMLELDSEPGKGSRFSLILRVRACDEEASLPEGWQPCSPLIPTARDAVPEMEGRSIGIHSSIQPAAFQYDTPPEELCRQLASHAREGRYSDVEDWLRLPVLKEQRYQAFRSAIRGALDAMDFAKIESLAQCTGPRPTRSPEHEA